MVPKHCSTRNRRLEISLLNLFSDARNGRLRAAFLMIPSRCLPRKLARLALLRRLRNGLRFVIFLNLVIRLCPLSFQRTQSV